MKTPKELLAEGAAAAGLSSHIEPFAEGESLRERLSAHPFLMAPMAGVTDAAWRLMARAGGAGLAYTEMVSVAGIHYGGEKTWELVVPEDAEPDIAVQLFGSKPEQFAEAAEAVSARLGNRLALIDINMACPVPKVTRKGEGSALMRDPERASEIVRAVCGHTDVPVTAKIRRGFLNGEELAVPFAHALEEAGVSAIAVHGRSAQQLYRGKASWQTVADVAAAVSVPVIGSGDVLSADAARSMLAQCGCAAVMVARGSYGDPWIFRDAESGTEASHSVEERLAAFALHVRLLEATGAHLARARSLAGWYMRGLPNASAWRERAMHCMSVEEYLSLIAAARATLEEAGCERA
ncbi:MAG: tRNA dihydrouridine synthase [Atopobiaceae bacterium]